MGRNAAIKRFDPHGTGQPLSMLETAAGHAPVIAELLSSPWIRRASELPSGDGQGKRAEAGIEVIWCDGSRAPVEFTHAGRRRRVEEVVARWAVERRWWDPSGAVSRRCFRVVTEAGVFDLAYDRRERRWLLTGVAD